MTWLFFVIATIQSLTRNQLNTRLTSNENQMKLCWVRDALKLSFCGPRERAVNKWIKWWQNITTFRPDRWDYITFLPLLVINCPLIVYHTSLNCHWEVIWYYGSTYDTGFSGLICTSTVCKLKDSSIESTSFYGKINNYNIFTHPITRKVDCASKNHTVY